MPYTVYIKENPTTSIFQLWLLKVPKKIVPKNIVKLNDQLAILSQ